MATIQEAMSNSESLLEAAIDGSIEPSQLEEMIKGLLSSPLGARGFMAALAIRELPANEHIRTALCAGIKAGKEHSYDLIVKNIIMAGCTAQEHKKNNREREAALSQATAENSLSLALLLEDDELAQLAGRALAAIKNRPLRSSQSSDDKTDSQIEYWHKFFERWGYGKDHLAKVEPLLKAATEVPR